MVITLLKNVHCPQFLRGLFIRSWVFLLGIHSAPCMGLLPQTTRDFDHLRDILREHLASSSDLRERLTPTLLATPVHHWFESRNDFAAHATSLVKSILTEPGDVIICGDCNLWRLNIATSERVHIQNGDISLSELGLLKTTQKYEKARSMTFIRETPSGIELKVVEIQDGRILLSALADGNSNLDSQKPWLRHTKERDRRLRGEGLTYGFLNAGFYPKPVIQFEFIEQWGAHNQHLSGVGLSLINPNIALGAVYHYLLASNKKLHFSGAIYMPLAEAIGQVNNREPSSLFVLQTMAQYNFSKSHAFGLSISSQGIVSLGLVFQDMLLLPFIF